MPSQVTKTCSLCGRDKPLDEFNRHAGCKDGRRGECRDCTRSKKKDYDGRTGHAAQKRYRATERGQQSILRTRLRQYGLTVVEYDRMVEQQEGACAICRDQVELFIDHNHRTGVVRGLLCRDCNLGIGHFTDDPDRLRRAADYCD